jgi:hypothetical protein
MMIECGCDCPSQNLGLVFWAKIYKRFQAFLGQFFVIREGLFQCGKQKLMRSEL